MSKSIIEVREIVKRYDDTLAVAGISFDVFEGEIFGLLGPNGAGKTTTMECVEGVRKRDSGTVTLFGIDPQLDSSALNERIGVQLQESELQKRIKVGEAVHLWASLYPNPVDADALLERLGLGDKRNTWFMNLSGGQKQRLFVALSLINDPDLVFWDELTTGLDPQARRAIWDMVLDVKRRGKTVFLTTHLMEEAERLCDRVAIIEHGEIIALGSPADLVKEHCPERSVVFSVDGDADLTQYRSIESLSDAKQNGIEIRLDGVGESFVSQVIHCIADRNIPVLDFRTEYPNLEDVFLKLTGHGIRD
ncbi:MAG: ABC transporter ATP-binding protein [Candidatus Hydrogenedentota bacterium]